MTFVTIFFLIHTVSVDVCTLAVDLLSLVCVLYMCIKVKSWFDSWREGGGESQAPSPPLCVKNLANGLYTCMHILC